VKLEIGNLVRVRYPTDTYFNGEEYMGIIIEAQERYIFDKMWCFKTGSAHILNRFRDEIEVINK